MEAKLPTVWADGKPQPGRSSGLEKVRREKKRNGEDQKGRQSEKKDAGARRGRKVAKQCVFPMVCDSGGSKSRLAKAAGAEPAGQMKDEKLHALVVRSAFESKKCESTPLEVEMLKKCTALWREAHLEVKLYKAQKGRTTFGS